jgi:hypothetical protein
VNARRPPLSISAVYFAAVWSIASPRCGAQADPLNDEAEGLSLEQVRRSINRSSIGRWKNYEFAFDGSWDELAALHESRRARPTAEVAGR